MRRLASVASALLVQTACVGLTTQGGIEVSPLGAVGGIAEAQAGSDAGGGRVGYLITARGSRSYGDVGIGVEVCKRTYGWSSAQFCGQLVPIELGLFEGNFAIGATPSLSLGLWKPTKVRPGPGDRENLKSVRPTHAIVVDLVLGVHVRPLRSFEGTTPFLGLTVGGGIGASWY